MKKQINLIADIIGAIVIITIPILGLLYWFSSLCRKHRKIDIAFVSFFFAIFIYAMPPTNDLYRHYLVFTSGQYISLDEIKDFSILLVFLNTNILVFFQKNGLHFNLVPSIYVFISVFIILFISNNLLLNDFIDRKNSFSIYFLPLLGYQLLFLASGLRYGIATYISIYASIFYLLGQISMKKFAAISFIAILFHPSILFIQIISFFSKKIYLNKFHIISSLILFFAIGNFLPEIINLSSNLIGAEKYAYAYADSDGEFGSLSGKNSNGIIAYLFNFAPISYLLIHVFFRKKEKNQYLLNACLISTIFIVFSNKIPVLSSRAAISLLSFFLISFFINYDTKLFFINRKIYKILFTMVMLFYFFIINFYIERRVIIFGEMWKSTYTPTPILLFDYQNNFNQFLPKIGTDGAWIKDNAATE